MGGKGLPIGNLGLSRRGLIAAIGASAQGSNAISCTATDSNGHNKTY